MTNTNSLDTAEKLRYLRKQKHVTQKQAADSIGISPNTYASYECGGSIPSSATGRQDVADYFGVDGTWLFGKDACKQRVCKYCGLPLPETAFHRQEYCSRKCSKAAVKQRAEDSRKNKYCVVCGEPLGKGRSTYCSDRCWRRSWDIEKQSATKYCRNCGAPLDSNRKQYCTPECAADYRSKKQTAFPIREQWDPKSGETYREFQLRTDPVFRQIYIRPGGRK